MSTQAKGSPIAPGQGNDVPQVRHTSLGEAHCHVTGACTQRVVLPILPVKVMTTGGRTLFMTHTILDSGSNSTFCSAVLAKKLGIIGK